MENDEKDRLDKIVEMQKSIMARWYEVDKLSFEEKEKRTLEFLVAIIAEVGECLSGDDSKGVKGYGALNWKSWKKTKAPTDIDYLKTEFIDIFHFILEIMIIWNCDSNEIYKRYMEKANENIRRYNSGY